MASNSKPRSDSSASNKKKKYQPERAHVRSSRYIDTETPRVMGGSRSTSSQRRGSSASRTKGSQGYNAQSSRTSGSRATSARSSSRTHAGTRQSSRASGTRANAQAPRNTRAQAQAQRNTTPKRRRGIGFKLGIVALIVMLVVGGFVALYFSNLLPITEVQVAGNVKLESSYVIELADVPDNSTFLRTDTESITSRLLSEPWIQSVSIERVFPGTLVLNISERPIAAVVDIVPETANDSTRRWVISDDGVWIAQVEDVVSATSNTEPTEGADASAAEDAPPEEQAQAEGETQNEETDISQPADGATSADDSTPVEGEGSNTQEEGNDTQGSDQNNDEALADDLKVGASSATISAEELVSVPKIKDVSAAVKPVAGEVETDEGITNALALLSGFSEEMRAMVASISAPDAVKTTLTLYNNVGVAFGAAEDIEAKEQAIATLLAEHEGTITYINVRVADRASYRATE